ncbi:MAG: NifB/NifX family molybdenum-iron cluster-binding protein [Candidatus Njordarchaeia archaeon]
MPRDWGRKSRRGDLCWGWWTTLWSNQANPPYTPQGTKATTTTAPAYPYPWFNYGYSWGRSWKRGWDRGPRWWYHWEAYVNRYGSNPVAAPAIYGATSVSIEKVNGLVSMLNDAKLGDPVDTVYGQKWIPILKNGELIGWLLEKVPLNKLSVVNAHQYGNLIRGDIAYQGKIVGFIFKNKQKLRAKTMKVAVAIEFNNREESPVATRFARTPLFAIVDVENKQIQSLNILSNPHVFGRGGLGVVVAQWLTSMGVQVAIGPSFCPNTAYALQSLGIEIVMVPPGIPLNRLPVFFESLGGMSNE